MTTPHPVVRASDSQRHPRWRTVGLDVAGNKLADGSLLYDGDREIGMVTSAHTGVGCALLI
ncbi:MAG: hypothetical protein SGJ07_08745 [Rhodospirillaceae bacterium]|nr:hypothetical protein [Rhodospirillaceae bacterium]